MDCAALAPDPARHAGHPLTVHIRIVAQCRELSAAIAALAPHDAGKATCLSSLGAHLLRLDNEQRFLNRRPFDPPSWTLPRHSVLSYLSSRCNVRRMIYIMPKQLSTTCLASLLGSWRQAQV